MYMYMELYDMYSTQANRQKGGERNPRNPYSMKRTNKQQKRHRVPSLENWGGGYTCQQYSYDSERLWPRCRPGDSGTHEY